MIFLLYFADFPGIHIEEEVPAAIPPVSVKRDYSHEAEEYEKKLIQVGNNQRKLQYSVENM